ncbi:MAG: radical SAM protein [Planctomycetota bacterium]
MRLAHYPLTVAAHHLGRVTKPSWCTYLVNFRCNARCGMCDSWRMKPGTEMSPEQVRMVFQKIGPLDVVRLSGGEPFLRDDFLELAEAVDAESNPGVVHITTNGSFPERILDFTRQFHNPKKLRFMISFDGLESEHDANRGQDVTFELAEKSVRWLSKLRGGGIAVSINHTVISEESMASHEALCARFEPLGVDVHVVLAYSDSAMYGAKRFGTKAEDLIQPGYPLHPKLKNADSIGFVKRLIENLPRLKDRMLRIGKRYYLQGLLARLENNPNPLPHPSCVALRSHIRLLPDGSVPVCQFNTEKVGNLVTQSFDDVWYGGKTKESRDWVDACSGCWAECEVMPSAIYTGDVITYKG